jgi:LysM repeat protein
MVFLVAATVLVLLVRAGLKHRSAPPAGGSPAVAVTTGEQQATVRSGDTLGAIARRYDTTVEELKRLNPGIDPVSLRVGGRIRVK